MPRNKFQNVVFTAIMAFFWQILYAGPVVRLIFRTIFRKQLRTASIER